MSCIGERDVVRNAECHASAVGCVCALGGGPEALSFLPVLSPCAFVGARILVSVAVSFCKEKDVCSGACLVEVYFPKCWVSYAMYIMESVSYFGEEVFGRGV